MVHRASATRRPNGRVRMRTATRSLAFAGGEDLFDARRQRVEERPPRQNRLLLVQLLSVQNRVLGAGAVSAVPAILGLPGRVSGYRRDVGARERGGGRRRGQFTHQQRTV